MTILEALQSFNVYPIPVKTVDRICIERGLTSSDDYTISISASQAFELAGADMLVWLHDAPSLVEQAVGINNAINIKQDMLRRANAIYAKYDDPKFTGGTFGLVGEDWNA